MDLRDTPEEAAFRAELRTWLDDNLPEERRGWRGGEQRFGDEFGREWSRKLYEAGYAGLTWPKEYGGAGAPYSFQAIFYEEMSRAQAPSHVGVIGLGMAGPTIMTHGTEQQKQDHLSKILSAEEVWCQGFSEPGAGSDLAAVRTRMERRGDVFVVNGQKVWSSFAHIAEWCILVGLSDPEAPRYKGLSYMIVDMHSPGVEVRPLRQLTGEAEFNEIFFTDVEVPAENLLAEEGQGWQVAMTTLLHERGTLGFALTAALEVGVDKLIAVARERVSVRPLPRHLTSLFTATSSAAVSAKPSVPRSCSSVVIATCQPWPSSPSRLPAGTSTSVKKISLNSASPVICRSGLTSTPGERMSIIMYVRPL